MSAFVTLSSGRLCLRRWRDEDREAFATMNSDARVMEFFRGCLSRVESDAIEARRRIPLSGSKTPSPWPLPLPERFR